VVKLRADEHRYLVSAEGEEEALLKTVPGCRFVAAAQAHQLPRQPGSVIALDRLFGRQGWECPSDLMQELSEIRGRQPVPAQHEAHVSLVGNELSVECAFGDKELVKLVPGYRWSAPQRRWFLPASPMALAMLREEFGPLLLVAEDAAAFLKLKGNDEDAAVERARAVGRREPAKADPVAAVVEPHRTEPELLETGRAAGDHLDSPTVESLVERLVVAVESLERTIARLAERLPENVEIEVAGPTVEEVPAMFANEEPAADSTTWRELLAAVDADPEEVLARLSSQLQLAGESDLPALRALHGIASALDGDYSGALTFLRKAEEHSAVPLEAELQARSRSAYRDSVLALISAACQPERPIESMDALEEMVLAELVHDTGFDDGALAGREALELLSFLMDDAHLRTFDPGLSDYCRLLHLLSVARGGRWMAAERVIEMLRHRDLTEDGFALGLVVLSNTVFEQPCMDEWLFRWPPESSAVGFDDLKWIVSHGVPKLRSVSRSIAGDSAIALLGLISAAAVEVAQMDERRELVRLLPPGASARRYAEFLAAYQLAAAGHKRVAQDFPGYLQVLAESPLAQSAPHLLTVFVSDSGGAGSTTRRIAEEVFLESVEHRGVADPATEVLELLDMLADSPKADRLMNRLGLMVEEDGFPGASSFNHSQRLALFECALKLALKAGHDVDCVEAFDRLVREMEKHGEMESVRSLCLGIPQGFKPLQLPVGQALLTLQLQAGEDFEAAAEMVLRQSDSDDPKDEGSHELKGLAIAFPRFREFLEARQVALAGVADVDLSGRRLVVVGGHEWLRKLAMPKFESWGVKATWLDPDSAKNGTQALDLAAGSTDLVIVNTACISHAASGRVKEQADKAGIRKAYHNSRGVGALLSIAREALADTAPPVVETKPLTKHDRRKKLLR